MIRGRAKSLAVAACGQALFLLDSDKSRFRRFIDHLLHYTVLFFTSFLLFHNLISPRMYINISRVTHEYLSLNIGNGVLFVKVILTTVLNEY